MAKGKHGRVFRRGTGSDTARLKRGLFQRSPCGRPPIAVTGLDGDFDRLARKRHDILRLPVHWDEVAEDTSGFPIALRSYAAELEVSSDGGSNYFLDQRATVSPKTDGDENEAAHHIWKKINGKLWYRMRVRAVARDGCKGAWSAWKGYGNPGADEPAAPTNVKIHDRSVDRVVTRWQAPDQPDDNTKVDTEIAHYQVALMQDSTAAPTHGTWYEVDKMVQAHHASFKLGTDALGTTIYAWVRSVDDDGGTSAWIPATIAGNSNPSATPSGVDIQGVGGSERIPKAPTGLYAAYDTGEGGRHNRIRLKARWVEVSEATDDETVRVSYYTVEVEHSSTGGGSWTQAKRFTVGPKDDDDPSDKFHTVLKGLAAKKFYRLRVSGMSRSGIKGLWANWFEIGQANGDAPPTPTNVKIHGRARDRVHMSWSPANDPDNSSLQHDNVHVYGAEISTSSTFASSYDSDRALKGHRISFKVDRADEGSTFYGRAWTVSPDKDISAKIPATLTGNSAAGTAPSPVKVKVSHKPGHVSKFSGTLTDDVLELNPATGLYGKVVGDGSSLSTAMYATLFANIGYTHGGSGNTFYLPDYRRRTPRGVGSGLALGANEGETEGNRGDEHGQHRDHRHRHKHHHKHQHKHDGHGPHETHEKSGLVATSAGSAHDHGIPNQSTDGPSSGNTAASGGAVNVPGSAHKHTSQSWSTNTSGAHDHSVAPRVWDVIQGSKGHNDHGGHADDDTDSADKGGAPAELDIQGPTDTGGTAVTLDEAAAPSGKGHKKHPHIGTYFLITTGE